MELIIGFLGTHICKDLDWTANTAKMVKTAHQRLFFLRILRRHCLSTTILVNFCLGAIESVLTRCVTVLYGNCTVADRKMLRIQKLPNAS